MEEEEASLQSFLKWASYLGVTDSPSSSTFSNSSCLGHSLCISYFPVNGGRGMAAVRELKKGEMILRVPKSALLTRDNVVLKDHNFALSLQLYPSLSNTQVLAVCLLAEMNKGQSSYWYPYLMQLPRSYDTLASFRPFETKALQVDDAIWLTERATSKAELDWRGAIGLLKRLKLKPQYLKFKAWLWASATISSRTLHIPWDDAGCLCPVGDFFNYAAPGEELASNSCSVDSLLESGSFHDDDETEDQKSDREQQDAFSERLTDGGYEEDLAAYCFYAKKSYHKNEQVLLSYGTYTNLELLEHYGFLLNKNPNEKVFIPLTPDIAACHSWPVDSLYIQHDGQPSFALLSTLRLWATTPTKRKSVSYLAFSGSQLSPENEIIVMKWILSTCRAILKSLPSTLEDDQLLLDAIDKAQQLESLKEPNNLSSAAAAELCKFIESMSAVVPLSVRVTRSLDKWKLAIEWRLSYKKAIVDCITFCSQIIESLTSSTVHNLKGITSQCHTCK